MPRRLPTFPEDPFHTQTIALDGDEYRLSLAWREALRGWYLSVSTDEGVSVYEHIRLTPQSVLTAGLAPDNGPPGEFVARGPVRYRREALGRSLVLYYLSSGEIGSVDNSQGVVVR
jgi:hypothetical protein